MIVGINQYLKVGKSYSEFSISDSNGDYYDIPFLVIRKASRLEWLKSCEETNVSREDFLNVHRRYYYEISVD